MNRTGVQIRFFILVVAAVWYLLLFWKNGVHPTGYWSVFGKASATIVFGALVFEKYLWKWRVFQGWLVKNPNLNGTWKVTLKSDFNDPNTGDLIPPIEGFAAIKQDLSSLSIHFMTKESESWMVAVDFEKSPNGKGFQVVTVYRNQPGPLKRGNGSEMHHGATILNTHGEREFFPDFLSGEYWTDRMTTGEMKIENRKNVFLTNFGLAQEAFEQDRDKYCE